MKKHLYSITICCLTFILNNTFAATNQINNTVDGEFNVTFNMTMTKAACTIKVSSSDGSPTVKLGKVKFKGPREAIEGPKVPVYIELTQCSDTVKAHGFTIEAHKGSNGNREHINNNVDIPAKVDGRDSDVVWVSIYRGYGFQDNLPEINNENKDIYDLTKKVLWSQSEISAPVKPSLNTKYLFAWMQLKAGTWAGSENIPSGKVTATATFKLKYF